MNENICIHILKTMYIKYIELCTLFENCSTLYYIEFKTLCEGLDTECIDLTLSVICEEKYSYKKKKNCIRLVYT